MLVTEGAGLNDHPALIAWRQVSDENRTPSKLQVLKRKNRSFVSRLIGVGYDGGNVIAKRREFDKADVERVIYQRVLPCIGMDVIHFYGFFPETAIEGEQRYAWLFIEDIGERRYSPDAQEERTLLARWLANFHVRSTGSDFGAELPGRGPYEHRRHLETIIRDVPSMLRNPRLLDEERGVLEAILPDCEEIERGWSTVEKLCASAPASVMHGDCLSKNIHVIGRDGRSAVQPLDWSAAGYGPIGLDLGQSSLPSGYERPMDPDIDEYHSIVSEVWPDLSVELLHRLTHLGRLFWAVDVISWCMPEFESDWGDRANLVPNFQIYGRVLGDEAKAIFGGVPQA